MKCKIISFCAALSAMLASPLMAAAVIEGVTATATSWWDMPANVSGYQHPKNIVNNLGMVAPYGLTDNHSPHGDAYGQWHAVAWANNPNPAVTFDLGGSFDLEQIYIWNGNQTNLTGRGVKEFVLSVSSDGSTYTTVGTYNLTQSANNQPNKAQIFSLAGRNGITHVKIRVNSTHDVANNDYANLSEVKFTKIVVPEVLKLNRFTVAAGKATLAFPSAPGQVFDIFRSIDLVNGLVTPFVAGLPAASSTLLIDSQINAWPGGVTLGDSAVDFQALLSVGVSYVLVPLNGVNVGREIPVVSWTNDTITLTEDIQTDLTWNGFYKVRTPLPTETVWIDTALPAGGKAFYRVGRR